jgi:hypothetical protein
MDTQKAKERQAPLRDVQEPHGGVPRLPGKRSPQPGLACQSCRVRSSSSSHENQAALGAVLEGREPGGGPFFFLGLTWPESLEVSDPVDQPLRLHVAQRECSKADVRAQTVGHSIPADKVAMNGKCSRKNVTCSTRERKKFKRSAPAGRQACSFSLKSESSKLCWHGGTVRRN